MPSSPTPRYLDWQFWSAVAAFSALALSQLPPLRLWFRPRRLEVEVHSRLFVTHTVGNPNVQLYVSVQDTGGRELRIRSTRLAISRDGTPLVTLPAQNYFENSSSTSPVLFVPYSLKPGETWAHNTAFVQFFDRATEKQFRQGASLVASDIRAKLAARASDEKGPVLAESSLVKPFKELFDRLFVWILGEYVVELTVEAEASSASFAKKYRFTLFESDSAELRSHANDYQFGAGISYTAGNHTGVFVPLLPHSV